MLLLTKMRSVASRQTSKEFMRFAIVGGIATAIHYLLYLVLQNSMNAGIAYTIGYAVSFVVNFLLTSVFTFKAKATVKKGVGFGVAHLCNYLLQMGLLYAVLTIGIRRDIAPVPVYCIAIPLNFLMVRFVFKSHKI